MNNKTKKKNRYLGVIFFTGALLLIFYIFLGFVWETYPILMIFGLPMFIIPIFFFEEEEKKAGEQLV